MVLLLPFGDCAQPCMVNFLDKLTKQSHTLYVVEYSVLANRHSNVLGAEVGNL